MRNMTRLDCIVISRDNYGSLHEFEFVLYSRRENIDLDNSLPLIVSLIKQGSELVKDTHNILASLNNHIGSRCGGG